ncbi:MAG: hypothetical protein IJ808_02340 [Muribaculaceae bacterium]|nr:hypothetical protein [Muribaculaceae bacterium]
MNGKKRTIILIGLAFASMTAVKAQYVNVVQPKIMVLPKTINEDDNPIDVLNRDPNVRVAITTVKEQFQKRGADIVDIEAKMNNVRKNSVFQEGTTGQGDLKKELIDRSGADIYVEVEPVVSLANSGNNVKLILQAYDVSTAASLAAMTANSGTFYGDVAGLSMRAINKVADDFLNTIQTYMNRMYNEGRSLVVKFSFDDNSNYNMDSEMQGGELLNEIISDWMEDHAYKNNCHSEGTTSSGMTYDDFRVPLIGDDGRNYKVNHLSREIRKFFISIGLRCKTDIQGGVLYVKIL